MNRTLQRVRTALRAGATAFVASAFVAALLAAPLAAADADVNHLHPDGTPPHVHAIQQLLTAALPTLPVAAARPRRRRNVVQRSAGGSPTPAVPGRVRSRGPPSTG